MTMDVGRDASPHPIHPFANPFVANHNGYIDGGPIYSLSEVKRCAGRHLKGATNAVFFASVRAGEQAQDELNLDADGVAELILTLTENEYHGSYDYENSPSKMDAYVTRRRDGFGRMRDIYLKFKLTPSGQMIAIASCHPARY